MLIRRLWLPTLVGLKSVVPPVAVSMPGASWTMSEELAVENRQRMSLVEVLV